jgi:hypothetical protein
MWTQGWKWKRIRRITCEVRYITTCFGIEVDLSYPDLNARQRNDPPRALRRNRGATVSIKVKST